MKDLHTYTHIYVFGKVFTDDTEKFIHRQLSRKDAAWKCLALCMRGNRAPNQRFLAGLHTGTVTLCLQGGKGQYKCYIFRRDK